MAKLSPLEKEVFPQTLLIIEGDRGSIRLDAYFQISITVGTETTREEVPMRTYSWQTDRLVPEPPSIVDCNNDILQDMLGNHRAETTGEDNFETVRLVWAAYESASQNKVIRLGDDF